MPGASVSRLVSEQLAAFKENFGAGEVHRAKVLGVTPYQLLIVASMIEREAQIPARPAAGRGGHLQPSAPGHAARDRRDIRYA